MIFSLESIYIYLKKITLQGNSVTVYFNGRIHDLKMRIAFDFLILFTLSPELPNPGLREAHGNM